VNIFAGPLEFLRKREAERSFFVGREGLKSLNLSTPKTDLPANGEITRSARERSIFVEHWSSIAGIGATPAHFYVLDEGLTAPSES